MEIKGLNIGNEELWRKFIDKNSESKIQYSLDWKNAIEESYKNCKAHYYFGIENNRVKFIAPFFLIKSNLFGDRLISVPFLENGGFLGMIDKKSLKELKEKILGDLRNKNIKNIEIRLNSSMKDFERIRRIFNRLGFDEDSSKRKFIINLTSKENLWGRFHKHTRNDIRMAIKSGLKIEKMNNKKELREFYRIYFQNMGYFGTPQHSYNFFRNLMEKLDKKFVGLNCYYRDKPIASLIMIYEDKEGYIAFNVSSHNYRKYRPNDLLYWEVIKLALKKRLNKIDLGEVDKDFNKDSREEGVYKFKNKWLGEIYDKNYFYYHLEKTKKDEKGRKEKLKKFRKIWKKIPSSIIRLIGPKIASQLGI